MTAFEERCEREDEADRLAEERAHERGFESGYSAAIHDARVEGSRAYHELHTDDDAGLAADEKFLRKFGPDTGN